MRFVILTFFVLLIGCGHQSDNQSMENNTAPIDTSAVIEEGQKISQVAFKTLSSNLKQAMKEGGIGYALEFCNVEAMPLTDSLSAHYGIELRRASHQPRNPVNRADSLEMKTIEKYLRKIKENEDLKPTTYAHENTISFHAPIRITNQLCLNCHGDPGTDIRMSDFETIQKLYPKDKATDFEMGELRGIWSIDFPKASFSEGQE